MHEELRRIARLRRLLRREVASLARGRLVEAVPIGLGLRGRERGKRSLKRC